MASSNILNKEIKLPILPRLPNKVAISLTRILLIIYSLFALAFLLFFWYIVTRDLAVENIFSSYFLVVELGFLYIVFSALLLFGLVQDLYAAIIINTKRMKAWEHSLIGTILATIPLSLPMFGSFVAFENFYTSFIGLFWLLLTTLLFWRIVKLRKG